jgi:hypothetical protein
MIRYSLLPIVAVALIATACATLKPAAPSAAREESQMTAAPAALATPAQRPIAGWKRGVYGTIWTPIEAPDPNEPRPATIVR